MKQGACSGEQHQSSSPEQALAAFKPCLCSRYRVFEGFSLKSLVKLKNYAAHCLAVSHRLYSAQIAYHFCTRVHHYAGSSPEEAGQSSAPCSTQKWRSDCKYYMLLQEHLNGNTQAITFLSRSLNTNLTCILIGLPMYLMGGSKG